MTSYALRKYSVLQESWHLNKSMKAKLMLTDFGRAESKAKNSSFVQVEGAVTRGFKCNPLLVRWRSDIYSWECGSKGTKQRTVISFHISTTKLIIFFYFEYSWYNITLDSGVNIVIQQLSHAMLTTSIVTICYHTWVNFFLSFIVKQTH